MIRKKKKNNPMVGQLYAYPLINKKWSISQICYIKEVENYLSVTVSYFDIVYDSIKHIENALDNLSLSNPVIIMTIANNPFKKNEWVLVGEKKVDYNEIDVEANISGSWGWYNKVERDTNFVMDMFFGLYPSDGFHDSNFLDKLLLPNVESKQKKMKKDFDTEFLGKYNLK